MLNIKTIGRFFFKRSFLILICIFLNKLNPSALCANNNKAAAVVLDDETGKVLYAENAHKIRHPASLTKKMTLYILFEALKAKKIHLKTKFRVSKLATIQMPSKLGLKPGDSITVENVILSLVTKSANDMAVVAAEGVAGSVTRFVAMMNGKARVLGMRNTRFYNPSGVPHGLQVTTAMDMITLGRALYHNFPGYYSYFKTKNFHYCGANHRNHNHMLGSFYGLDGIKTGFINASGFNISVSAARYNPKTGRSKRLFAVVMGGENRFARDKKAARLLEASFSKFLGNNSAGKGEETDLVISKKDNLTYPMPQPVVAQNLSEQNREELNNQTKARVIQTGYIRPVESSSTGSVDKVPEGYLDKAIEKEIAVKQTSFTKKSQKKTIKTVKKKSSKFQGKASGNEAVKTSGSKFSKKSIGKSLRKKNPHLNSSDHSTVKALDNLVMADNISHQKVKGKNNKTSKSKKNPKIKKSKQKV